MSGLAIPTKKLKDLADKNKPEIPENFIYIKGKYDKKSGAEIQDVKIHIDKKVE